MRVRVRVRVRARGDRVSRVATGGARWYKHAAVAALESNASTQLGFSRPASDTLQISLAGAWEMQAGLPRVDAVQEAIEAEPRPRQVSFDTGALRGWDSGLLTFLVKVGELCAERGIKADRAGLPDGVRRLLDLAEAVPERKGARSSEAV